MFPTFLILSAFLLCGLGQVQIIERQSEGSHPEEAACVLQPGQKMLGVLPGAGWDNLVNEERGLTANRQVHSLCRISSDGQYLIPDDVVIEPIKSSQIELSSEVFSHFTNYTALTAYSMNSGTDVKFHFTSIGGDFSFEKNAVRTAENQNNGLTVRSQVRHRWYVVHQLPDSHLHPRLRNRLLDIAAHLDRSNITEAGDNNDGGIVTPQLIERINRARFDSSFNPQVAEQSRQAVYRVVDGLRAAYLADLIVRDFGTHCVVAVEAGAVVAKIDSLVSSSRVMNNEDKLRTVASASASFASFFNLKTSAALSLDEKDVEAYNSKVASSFIVSHGGPSFKVSDLNLTAWEEGLAEHLVAIDRRGRPIYDLITPRSLPELSESLTFRLAAAVKAAVVRYYEANSVIGCLDPTSIAYDSSANVAADHCDDLSYQDPSAGIEGRQLPFGGVYTTCEGPNDLCSRHKQPNLATGYTSCPMGYRPVSLLHPQIRSCAIVCQDRGIFQKPHCVHECAITNAYWCALNPSANTSTDEDAKQELGLLFGGIYTDTSMNPITNDQSCPLYYESQQVGRRIHVCVSSDRVFGPRYSLAFGGLYTCRSGNPMYYLLSLNSSSTIRMHQTKTMLTESTGKDDPALNWPKQCPNGYTSHMAGIEDTCLINYCIVGDSLKIVKERRLKRPPFVQLPEYASIAALPGLEKILNQPLRLVDPNSRRAYYVEEGEWVPDRTVNEVVDVKTWTFLIVTIVMIVVLLVLVMGFAIHCIYTKMMPSSRRGPFNVADSSTA